VDRNWDQGGGNRCGIIWIDIATADWSAGVFENGLFDGTGSTDPGLYGITTDGTALWVTNEYWGEVYKVTNGGGVSLVADTSVGPRGITLIDDDVAAGLDTVVVSDADGTLLSTLMNASGATLASWGDADGYHYLAGGMAVDSAGDLLMAQPDGSEVRAVAPGGATSTIVAAGMRVGLAATTLGTAVFLATAGQSLFANDGSAQPDGAILAIDPSGISRVLYVAPLLAGLALSGPEELTVSDCVGQRIFAIDLSNDAQTDLLDASDGLGCPAGLVIDASGNLYYADANLLGGPTTIGRLDTAAVHTPTFGTNFQDGAAFLALAGGDLMAAPLSGGGPVAIEAIYTGTGGTPFDLVSSIAFNGGALAGSPDDRAFVVRFGTGEILEIDPVTGQLMPFGSALPPDAVLGPGSGSFAFTAGFQADGTMIVPDFGQNAIVAVTP
ncbi:MAG TPA: hypothetical protein VL172_07430, partial [Kofleriaceae bacterium]|nr:hypothetical protein [Kofleriaceae bacterium]